MRYRLMATYRGVPYEAGTGPEYPDVVLFAACPPPEDLGFEPAPGHWRKQVIRSEIDALWESRPIGFFRGEQCIVLDDLSDRLHIAYLGTDPAKAARLGYWQVDRGVFELLTPREEVTGLAEERVEKPLQWAVPDQEEGTRLAYPYRAVPPQAGTPAPPESPLPPAGPPPDSALLHAGPAPQPNGTFPAVPGDESAAAGSPDTSTRPVIPAPATEPAPRRSAQPATPQRGPLAAPEAPAPQPGQPAVPEPAAPSPAQTAQFAMPARFTQTVQLEAPEPAAVPEPAEPPAQTAVHAPAAEQPAGQAVPPVLPEGRKPQPHLIPPLPGDPPLGHDPHLGPALLFPATVQAAAPVPATTATAPATAPVAPAAPEAQPGPPRGHGSRAARRQRVPTRSLFCELADLAAIPRGAYALEAEADGAMCLLRSGDGYEVFTALNGARHEVRFFADEEAAYFYLFGLLAAEAVRSGTLSPGSEGLP